MVLESYDIPLEGRGTEVERRAGGLEKGYIRKLENYDRRFHGATGEEAGPLVSRLQA